MEIFKLLGVIALDGVEKVKKQLSETAADAENSQSKIGTAFEKIGGAAVKVGTTVAAGIAAGATAIGVMTKQSLDSYAEYEQLVGGIETLFGARGAKSVIEYAALVGTSVGLVVEEFEMLQAAQEKAMDYAAQAYKNAGLSANEYMETVTGLAAALKQSTASELDAAEYANLAIQDMADNANKMGSSMSSIQTAYQGFAKQNYSMLDNLKLGYGGTQQEMFRLLCDAVELDETFDAVFSIDSKGHLDAQFADIVEAIHIVQTEMGITGTTANEASSTIQGSMSMAKSAWKNLLTGFADENANIGQLLQNLIDSALTALGNIAPRIEIILSGIIEGLNRLVPVIVARLPGILQQLLPGLITGATALLTGLVAVLPNILKILIQQVPLVISQLGTALTKVFPVLVKTVQELFQQLWDFIAIDQVKENLPTIAEQALVIVQEFATSLADKAGTIVEEGGKMLVGLAEGISSSLPVLIQRVPTIISTFANIINDNMPKILKIGIDILVTLVKGIIDSIPTIIENIPKIITAIVDVFMAFNWLNLGKNIMTFFKNGFTGMKSAVTDGAKDVLTSLKSGFKDLPKQLAELGKQAIQGFVNGIKNNIGQAVRTAISGVASVVDGIRDALDINSPSRVFEEIGNYCVQGFSNGVEDLENGVTIDTIASVNHSVEYGGIGSGSSDMSNSNVFCGILDAIHKTNESIEEMNNALSSMKFVLNNREFARLVKAV